MSKPQVSELGSSTLEGSNVALMEPGANSEEEEVGLPTPAKDIAEIAHGHREAIGRGEDPVEDLSVSFALTQLKDTEVSSENGERDAEMPSPTVSSKNSNSSWWPVNVGIISIGKRLFQAAIGSSGILPYPEETPKPQGASEVQEAPAKKDGVNQSRVERTSSINTNDCEQPSEGQHDQIQSNLTSKRQHEINTDVSRTEYVEDADQSEQGTSGPTTPKLTSSLLSPVIKEEDIDVLADALSRATLWENEDSATGTKGKGKGKGKEAKSRGKNKLKIEPEVRGDSNEDVLESYRSPADKGVDIRYYFKTPKGVYCFDEYRNLYSDDGDFLGDCSFTFGVSELNLRFPHFCVGEVRYWFDKEGLLSVDTYGTPYYIDTWQNEHDETTKLLESFSLVTSESSMDAVGPNSVDFLRLPAELQGRPLCTDGYDAFPATGSPYIEKCDSTCGSLLAPSSDKLKDAIVNLYGVNDLSQDMLSRATTHPLYSTHTGQTNQLSLSHKTSAHEGCIVPRQLESSSILDHGLESAIASILASDEGSITANEKTDACALNPNPESLQQTLRGQAHIAMSPEDPFTQSPSAPPTNNSYQTAGELSLFHASEPPLSGMPPASTQCDSAEAPKSPKKARVVKKRKGEEHRRCMYCGKVFRRPSSLVEHIYTHTLEKPETCPFVGCKSAFATKPNLRRHFLVHKVGLMKDYKPGTNATLDVIPESNEGGQVNVIRWRQGYHPFVAPYTHRARSIIWNSGTH
ncbi:hypothetical protein BN14_06138 [Rhizoctonia solani AG-1 IB]|nr:hypothetical protein BN14_06138 [Rhizoctonia solani AG-1 IB]